MTETTPTPVKPTQLGKVSVKQGLARAAEVLQAAGQSTSDAPRTLMARALLVLRAQSDAEDPDYVTRWPYQRQLEQLTRGHWTDQELAAAVMQVDIQTVARHELARPQDEVALKVNHVKNVRDDYRQLRGIQFAYDLMGTMTRELLEQTIREALNKEKLNLPRATETELIRELTDLDMPEGSADLTSDLIYELHTFVSLLGSLHRLGVVQITGSRPQPRSARSPRQESGGEESPRQEGSGEESQATPLALSESLPRQQPTGAADQISGLLAPAPSETERLAPLRPQGEQLAAFMDYLDREGYVLARRDQPTSWLPGRGRLSLAEMGDQTREELIVTFLGGNLTALRREAEQQ